MKKWILLVSLFISCQEDKPDPFDETLPLINIDKIRIVESGGGFGVPPTYSLSFSGEIINLTENVFKTYRQNVKFTALNGNQVNGQMTLPMFRWLCPYDTLYSGGQTDNFEEGFIDSVVTWGMVATGSIITYGVGNECDD
ncbi:MAG TPA: hypothetical protein EYO27_01940 [Candidatus Marinimicrobia bacterium]|jgi:hypothetical protein|nr:hypothetical protein [Candidatus Neomarinimicrobiota bacterium]HIB33760.1 hypothetical protein [Candidatus Neomarinimicrobiota bacterium]|tara:strand:- start:765 stop:1184 length:420 start_codon:yes stop_codon:yes gene_type:complete